MKNRTKGLLGVAFIFGGLQSTCYAETRVYRSIQGKFDWLAIYQGPSEEVILKAFEKDRDWRLAEDTKLIGGCKNKGWYATLIVGVVRVFDGTREPNINEDASAASCGHKTAIDAKRAAWNSCLSKPKCAEFLSCYDPGSIYHLPSKASVSLSVEYDDGVSARPSKFRHIDMDGRYYGNPPSYHVRVTSPKPDGEKDSNYINVVDHRKYLLELIESDE